MSQNNVERIVGRLATDEDFRREFHDDPERVVRGIADRGFELTQAEVAALVRLDPITFDRFADAIDPRLQKASLRVPVSAPGNAGRLA